VGRMWSLEFDASWGVMGSPGYVLSVLAAQGVDVTGVRRLRRDGAPWHRVLAALRRACAEAGCDLSDFAVLR
jgi:hypothetical protein